MGPHYILLSCYTYCLPHFSIFLPSPPPSSLHLLYLSPSIISTSSCYTLTLSLISPPPSLLISSHSTLSHLHFPLHLPHLSATFPSYTLSPSPSYLLHLPFLHPLTLSLISPPPSLLTPSHPLPHLSSTFPSYTLSLSHYFLFYFSTPSHTLPNLSSTFPPCIHLASVLSYSYAFALEESSQRRTAEALARKALAMNPTIAWSYHALCESEIAKAKG